MGRDRHITTEVAYTLPGPSPAKSLLTGVARLLRLTILTAVLLVAGSMILAEILAPGAPWLRKVTQLWVNGPLTDWANKSAEIWRRELHFTSSAEFEKLYKEEGDRLVYETGDHGNLRVFRRLDCGPTAKPVTVQVVPAIMAQIAAQAQAMDDRKGKEIQSLQQQLAAAKAKSAEQDRQATVRESEAARRAEVDLADEQRLQSELAKTKEKLVRADEEKDNLAAQVMKQRGQVIRLESASLEHEATITQIQKENTELHNQSMSRQSRQTSLVRDNDRLLPSRSYQDYNGRPDAQIRRISDPSYAATCQYTYTTRTYAVPLQPVQRYYYYPCGQVYYYRPSR